MATSIHGYLVRRELQKEPDCTDERSDEIEAISRRLEHTLYSKADSMETYKDLRTLKQRLRSIAMGIMNNPGMTNNSAATPADQQAQAPPEASGGGGQEVQASGGAEAEAGAGAGPGTCATPRAARNSGGNSRGQQPGATAGGNSRRQD